MAEKVYDVAVIGGGPAGMTATLFCARYNLRVALVFSKLGGAMAEAHIIENYPGFKSIGGMELAEKMFEQVASYSNVEVVMDEVIDARKDGELFVLTIREREIKSRALILAVGMQRRKLSVKGEEEFLGRGVSYCATCDGMFFRDKVVAVIGGGDAAFDAILFLSNIARKVYLIHRREEFRAEEIKVEAAKKLNNVEFILNSVVEELDGKDKLERIKVKNIKTNEEKWLDVDGLFIEIGSVPSAVLAQKLGVELDEHGFIKVNSDMSTNVGGVFAAGDITTASANVRQVATAVGEGAIAGVSAYLYLKKKR